MDWTECVWHGVMILRFISKPDVMARQIHVPPPHRGGDSAGPGTPTTPAPPPQPLLYPPPFAPP